MGIREFYAQYMNRPSFEYIPDPLGRLGQGQWKKTAQGPDAPTPPKPPVVPKPVPPTTPKRGPKRIEAQKPHYRSSRHFKLRNGRVIDPSGNEVPFESLSEKERARLFREWQIQNLRNVFD